jgi:hypothetical protein
MSLLGAIVGGIVMLIGFFMLVFGPGDRLQLSEFGQMARIVGLVLMGVGIIIIKL